MQVTLKIENNGIFVERSLTVSRNVDVYQFVQDNTHEMLDLINFKRKVKKVENES